MRALCTILPCHQKIAVDIVRPDKLNLIHASESAEAAQKEIGLLFKTDEIFPWKKIDLSQVYSEEELN